MLLRSFEKLREALCSARRAQTKRPLGRFWTGLTGPRDRPSTRSRRLRKILLRKYTESTAGRTVKRSNGQTVARGPRHRPDGDARSAASAGRAGMAAMTHAAAFSAAASATVAAAATAETAASSAVGGGAAARATGGGAVLPAAAFTAAAAAAGARRAAVACENRDVTTVENWSNQFKLGQTWSNSVKSSMIN